MLRPAVALQRLRPAVAPPPPSALLRSQFSPFLLAQRQVRSAAAAQAHKKQPKKGRPNAKPIKGHAGAVEAAETARVQELVKRWADMRRLSEVKKDEARLASLRKETLAALPHMQGTELTRVAHAAAAASIGRSTLSFTEPLWLQFWHELAAAMRPVLALPETDPRNNLQPRDLGNLAWSFAEAKVAAPSLFAALATRLTPNVGKLRPREVCSAAWAFAMLGEQAPLLFEALGEAASERLAEFRPAEVAALMWAFAASDHARTALFSRPYFGLFLEHLVFTESDLSQLHQFALWADSRCAPTCVTCVTCVARVTCGTSVAA